MVNNQLYVSQMSSKRSSKRRRLETVTNSSDVNDLTNSISSAVTAQVMANLKASGIIPQDTSHVNESRLNSINCENERNNPLNCMLENNTNVQNTTNYEISSNGEVHQGASSFCTNTGIHIPAQDVMSSPIHLHANNYKPLGRPLYSKINIKLQDKIRNKEMIDMSDILVDHQPTELDLHLAVKNNRVGLTSGKKRRFLTIESWTDAFSIFASVLRKANPSHPTIAEDLAIYMDLIRQIHKDGGDWFFYDTNFRQFMQNDDTLSWSFVDQVLHTRALNRSKPKTFTPPTSHANKPFPNNASRKTCHR